MRSDKGKYNLGWFVKWPDLYKSTYYKYSPLENRILWNIDTNEVYLYLDRIVFETYT